MTRLKNSAQRRSNIRLEQLEDRAVPTVVTSFANDNWVVINDVGPLGLSAGDTVRNDNDTTNPGSITGVFGTDAFSTISDAIANTAAGGTVNVLEGTYTENVILNNGLTLSPEAGVIKIDGDLKFGASDGLRVDVNGTTPGTGYDQIQVTGSVTLAGTLTVGGSGSVSSVSPGVGIIPIDNLGSGPVNGTFNGLPSGAIVTTLGGQQVQIFYTGGTGNDVMLIEPPLPPGTILPGMTPSTPPPTGPVVHLSAVSGPNGLITVYNADGTIRGQGTPFANLGNDVRVVTGDINGDRVDDIVISVGSGPSAGLVAGFDGATFSSLGAFYPFGAFPGGTNVAIGDVTGDSGNDLVVSTASGVGFVQVYDLTTGRMIASFDALPGLACGASLAVANLDYVGLDEIIVGVASNGPPIIAVYNVSGQLLDAFLAYPFPYSGGLNVAAGVVAGESRILVAPATSGASGVVELFSFDNHTLITVAEALPFADAGVRVALTDVNGDGFKDIFFGAAPGAGSWILAFDLHTLQTGALIGGFEAYPGYMGGVYVG